MHAKNFFKKKASPGWEQWERDSRGPSRIPFPFHPPREFSRPYLGREFPGPIWSGPGQEAWKRDTMDTLIMCFD